MLNDFVLEGAPLEVPDTRKVIPAIKREIETARKEGKSVIYVCDTHEPNDREFSKYGWPAHGVKGTDGGKVVEELKPQEGDIIVRKPDYSSFQNTNLEEILKNLGIDSLRITGCVTHICVMFTAYEATLRDYHVTVPEDAVAGLAKEDHNAALRIMKNVMGVEVI